MVSQNISQATDTKVLIACLCIAVVFVLMRTGARFFKTRQIPIAPEDLFIYMALSSFAIMCALYLAAMPTFYNAMAIEAGLMAPYASLEKDLVALLKEFFAVQIFFWLTLWSVKWSLLFMFRRLTEGLPLYTKIWWGVLAFTVLTFIGAFISEFTSCSSMHAWFTAGLCETGRDARAKAISLWYCMAVDILTDLMIMAIPLRVLWNLRISLIEKFSVGAVFVVGIITMVFAVVRVVSLNKSTSGGQVSTTWLILWGGIEGCVAIVVGCLPSFAIFIRGRVEASRVQYGTYTVNSSAKGSKPSSHLQSSRNKSQARTESVMLDEVEPIDRHADTGSQKSLVDGEIVITHGWSQKWHKGSLEDQYRERQRQLGLRNDA